ncbi:TetR family transcriptional regulator [Amphibiibacter pelophylacis]|uniref:TetR family transcriptional regulator n=1 Tax=Amphibiibacter pelophylacis TaxID=1799477 RepID=A0ACC6P250_9BURK
MARKTRELALETRHRLLDAAELLFDRQGVAATSLQQIATEADATRGAVYWHFRNKADLLDALLHNRVRQPLSALADSLLLQAQAASLQAPLDRVLHLLLGLAEGISADPAVRRTLGIAIFKVERGVDGDLKHIMGQSRSQGMLDLHSLIECLLNQPGPDIQASPPDATRAASGLAMIFEGLLFGWLLDLNDAPADTPPAQGLPERMRHVMNAYLRGLG